MSIEKMLKYQETDMRLIKLENELKNSECAKKMIAFQSATKKSFDTLTSMNDLAKNNMDTIVKYKTRYDDIIKQIDEISNEIVKESDDKQLEYYAKQLEKLLNLVIIGIALIRNIGKKKGFIFIDRF